MFGLTLHICMHEQPEPSTSLGPRCPLTFTLGYMLPPPNPRCAPYVHSSDEARYTCTRGTRVCHGIPAISPMKGVNDSWRLTSMKYLDQMGALRLLIGKYHGNQTRWWEYLAANLKGGPPRSQMSMVPFLCWFPCVAHGQDLIIRSRVRLVTIGAPYCPPRSSALQYFPSNSPENPIKSLATDCAPSVIATWCWAHTIQQS